VTQYARVEWHGDEVERQLEAAAVQGLGLAAEHLLKASRDLVPHEKGILEDTSVASVDPSTLSAAVAFVQPYAVRQHEELTWKHAPGRQAKYLEQPAETEADTMQGLIAAPIRRASR
jgi:hypothetical protein